MQQIIEILSILVWKETEQNWSFPYSYAKTVFGENRIQTFLKKTTPTTSFAVTKLCLFLESSLSIIKIIQKTFTQKISLRNFKARPIVNFNWNKLISYQKKVKIGSYVIEGG